MREKDETWVEGDDDEVMDELDFDEFSSHFRGLTRAKLLFTTSRNPGRKMWPILKDIMAVFPSTKYAKRRKHNVKAMVKSAIAKNFTHLVILQEKSNKPVGLYVIHLPTGPTAYFALTSYVPADEIPGSGVMTKHRPEVILNNFSTRLGVTVGRLLGSMLPVDPEFNGRRVVTFHNQRDFIFFRHHRYIFEDAESVRTQELGPRFTLRLRWLQAGTFDTKHGEFEWMYKKQHKGRKIFVL